MKLAADLHIHSCLSPCGDDDNTPNNIVGMAAIKGLDIIAVTDHNSAQNLPAVAKLCDEAGLLLLPGIEVQTVEEVHVLCYLPTVEAALCLSATLYEHLADIPNSAMIFGNQYMMNENDEVTGQVEKLLINSVDFSIDKLYEIVMELGGICVPAHINRPSNSLMGILGFIPLSPPFTAMEICPTLEAPTVDTSAYHILYSSDAHYLGDILERSSFIEVSEPTAAALIHKLKEAKNNGENT
ncbi:PHP domain-containing protein [Eubacteriales bacterium OttesenSCG-928-N14]|nr:PHP domain-containing protein [Eubacteriales bacterium OttesenSCG-928-N14]